MTKETLVDLASSLNEPSLLSNLNFINGKWKKAVSQQTYEVMNPVKALPVLPTATPLMLQTPPVRRAKRSTAGS